MERVRRRRSGLVCALASPPSGVEGGIGDDDLELRSHGDLTDVSLDDAAWSEGTQGKISVRLVSRGRVQLDADSQSRRAMHLTDGAQQHPTAAAQVKHTICTANGRETGEIEGPRARAKAALVADEVPIPERNPLFVSEYRGCGRVQRPDLVRTNGVTSGGGD